jgi:hypothetical protein
MLRYDDVLEGLEELGFTSSEADVLALIGSMLRRNPVNYGDKITVSFKTEGGEERSIVLPPDYSLQAGISAPVKEELEWYDHGEFPSTYDDEEAKIRSVISSGKFEALISIPQSMLKAIRFLLRDVAIAKRKINALEASSKGCRCQKSNLS